MVIPEHMIRQSACYTKVHATPERTLHQSARYTRAHATPERTLHQSARYTRAHATPERTLHQSLYSYTNPTIVPHYDSLIIDCYFELLQIFVCSMHALDCSI